MLGRGSSCTNVCGVVAPKLIYEHLLQSRISVCLWNLLRPSLASQLLECWDVQTGSDNIRHIQFVESIVALHQRTHRLRAESNDRALGNRIPLNSREPFGLQVFLGSGKIDSVGPVLASFGKSCVSSLSESLLKYRPLIPCSDGNHWHGN